MTESFHFKQFSVNQNQSAMKIGTDGVLLGAWTSLKSNPNSILDIGAGTGIVALMLAQRSQAKLIDALEIDDKAFEQCVENFEQSPWGDRLFCYHASLEDFTQEMAMDTLPENGTYDLIVCNPPYFKSSQNQGATTIYSHLNNARSLARFQEAMPFGQLMKSVSTLLSPEGELAVIIPFSEAKTLIELASKNRLYAHTICHVRGHALAEKKRSLIGLSFSKVDTEILELIIETSRHKYTQDYVDLTKDFYLKM